MKKKKLTEKEMLREIKKHKDVLRIWGSLKNSLLSRIYYQER